MAWWASGCQTHNANEGACDADTKCFYNSNSGVCVPTNLRETRGGMLSLWRKQHTKAMDRYAVAAMEHTIDEWLALDCWKSTTKQECNHRPGCFYSSVWSNECYPQAASSQFGTLRDTTLGKLYKAAHAQKRKDNSVAMRSRLYQQRYMLMGALAMPVAWKALGFKLAFVDSMVGLFKSLTFHQAWAFMTSMWSSLQSSAVAVKVWAASGGITTASTAVATKVGGAFTTGFQFLSQFATWLSTQSTALVADATSGMAGTYALAGTMLGIFSASLARRVNKGSFNLIGALKDVMARWNATLRAERAAYHAARKRLQERILVHQRRQGQAYKQHYFDNHNNDEFYTDNAPPQGDREDLFLKRLRKQLEDLERTQSNKAIQVAVIVAVSAALAAAVSITAGAFLGTLAVVVQFVSSVLVAVVAELGPGDSDRSTLHVVRDILIKFPFQGLQALFKRFFG